MCLLHIVELFLHHFIRIYVGATSGPDSWKSKLGKKIKELKDPKIRRFRPIPCPDFPIIQQDILKVEPQREREKERERFTTS